MPTLSDSEPTLDIRARFARIDKMRLVPWTIIVTALGAGAALFAAGAAFTKLLLD